MRVSDWFLANPRGRLGIVAGGEATEFRDWVLATTSTRIAVFAVPAEAGGYAAAIPADPAGRLTVNLTRGLDGDAKARAKLPQPAIYTAATIARAIEDEVRRLQTGARLVAGYPMRGSLTHRLATDRTFTLLLAHVAERPPSLIVHDVAHTLVSRNPAGADVILSGPPGRIEAVREDDAAAEPYEQQVLEHAEFLVKTDEATLARMHEFLSPYGDPAPFDHWKAMLTKHRAKPGHELMVELAVERLDRLRAVLGRSVTARG